MQRKKKQMEYDIKFDILFYGNIMKLFMNIENDMKSNILFWFILFCNCFHRIISIVFFLLSNDSKIAIFISLKKLQWNDP